MPGDCRPVVIAGTKRKHDFPSSANSHPSQSSARRTKPTGLTLQQTHAQARKRQRVNNVRHIASQTTAEAYHGPTSLSDNGQRGYSKAVSAPSLPPALPPNTGQIHVDKFVRAREFEIRALESSLRKASAGLSKRAFQNVPRELRRRTASHDVRRIPRRLRARAQQETIEDNTPRPKARRSARRRERKARAWLRAGRKDILRRMFGGKRQQKGNEDNDQAAHENRFAPHKKTHIGQAMATRAFQNRHQLVSSLKQANILSKKFRKRQVQKTWLPTHLYHAKRAHLTPSRRPLWRMTIPLSPTAKSYRPTHHGGSVRGAVAWDMSYMSTIGLSGPAQGILQLLEMLGVDLAGGTATSRPMRAKWIAGTRAWTGWLFERQHIESCLAPVTVLWCPPLHSTTLEDMSSQRQVMIRVHPSAFSQLWTFVLDLVRAEHQAVMIEDMRFEIGSIEVTGPAAAEAIVGTICRAIGEKQDMQEPLHLLSRLSAITDASLLPAGAIIAAQMPDPRLFYPPHEKKNVTILSADQQNELLQLLTEWPLDSSRCAIALFDKHVRFEACQRLPSQKAINRRKSLAPPGDYPKPASSDPQIPIVILPSSRAANGRGTGAWTLLLPWKCVLPTWHCLMYQPIASGGNPRLGGLDQKRQLAFESATPWFPGDYPGTQAGAVWNVEESEKRREAWARRPKGKRIEYDTLDLGGGRKGELGPGWACDWSLLVSRGDVGASSNAPLRHISSAKAKQVLSGTTTAKPQDYDGTLVTVKLTLLTRGVPLTCARIYRLPASDVELHAQWLALLKASKKPPNIRPGLASRSPSNASVHQRRRALAASLLDDSASMARAGEPGYPDPPTAADLLGFVTTGNFNLGQGLGTAIGSLSLSKIMESEQNQRSTAKESNICIVRNSGQRFGRLARWEFASQK